METNKQLLDDLLGSIQDFQNSREFFDLLKFMGRFTQYSPFNCALLYIQNPKVTYVATPAQWRNKHHRTVKPHSRPMVILAPMRPVMFVYDMVDTEGPPVPDYILNPFQVEGTLDEKNIVTPFITLVQGESVLELKIIYRSCRLEVHGACLNR